MSKGIIRLLIIFGLLLFIFGLALKKKPIIVIGFLTVGAGIYFGLGPDGILRKDQIVDNWSTLIGNAQGRASEIFQDTTCLIKETEAPGIAMEEKEIAPGFVSGMTGKVRQFLVITDKGNARLEPYKIFINARDYGKNLDVSWHLTYKPSLWQSIKVLFPFASPLSFLKSGKLDLFDEMDLTAYATNAHHCLLKSVDKILISLQQDPSSINRKSKGFLGIS